MLRVTRKPGMIVFQSRAWITRRMRSATLRASASPVARNNANSSPPNRIATSFCRQCDRSTAAISPSTRSPTPCE
jgi:hypothetical protein